MGRHRAPRRHAPVGILVAAGVVGSAGIAWAVGADPAPDPEGRVGTSVAPSSGASPFVTAPTPKPTASSTPVVVVVPSASSAPAPTTAAPTTTAAPAAPPPATSEPKPTRVRPSKGVVPTPRPTKSPK